MKQFTRKMSIVIALLASVVLLAVACGGDDDAAPATGQPAAPSNGEPAAPATPDPADEGPLHAEWIAIFADLEEARSEHGLTSQEGVEAQNEAFEAFLEVLPEQLPAPGDRETLRAFALSEADCYAGTGYFALGVFDPESTSEPPALLPHEEALAWFEAELAAADLSYRSGDLVLASEALAEFRTGVEYFVEVDGVTWRVVLAGDPGDLESRPTFAEYCPAP